MSEPLAERFPIASTSRVRTVPTSGSRAYGAPRGRTRQHPEGTRSHEGVVLFAPAGTAIESPVTGRVLATLDDAQARCGFGVIVQSATDGVRWTLCHLAAMPIVERGEHVEAGQVIGTIGTTGNAEGGGPHLHIRAYRRDALGIEHSINPTVALTNALAREAGERVTPTPPATVAPRPRTSSSSDASSSGVGAAVALGAVGAVYWLSQRTKRKARR